MVNLSSFLGGAAGGASVNIVINAIDNFSKNFKNAENGLQKFGQAAKTTLKVIGTGLAVFTVTSLQAAKQFEPVNEAFQKLNANSKQYIVDLNEATRGTVSNFDLMKNSNLLFQNVATATQRDMIRLAEASVVLGRAVGIDATQAYERLVVGIAKGETELLDELGLKLDATNANKIYAESLGKTVGELTANERATAALNAIMPELERRVRGLGGPGAFDDTFASNLERVAKAFKDIQVEAGLRLAPSFNDLTKSLIENKEEFVTAAEVISKLVVGAFQVLALYIKAAQIVAEGFVTVVGSNIIIIRELYKLLFEHQSWDIFMVRLETVTDFIKNNFIKRFEEAIAIIEKLLRLVGLMEEEKIIPDQSKDPNQLRRLGLIGQTDQERRGSVRGVSPIGQFFEINGKKTFVPQGRQLSPSNRGFNDFIMRPGQEPISFSPNDTVIGFKGKGMPGGTIININVEGSLIRQNDLMEEVSRVLQRSLSSSVRGV